MRDSVLKPQAHEETPLKDFFNVSFTAQQTGKVIKDNNDLDLPAHKILVATVRCENIANKKFVRFAANETWCQLEKYVQSGPVAGLGKKLTSILETCLSEYDRETTYFDDGVRSRKRKHLEEKLLQLIQPVFQAQICHIRSDVFDKFKAAFDKALDGGKEFSLASHNCSESFFTLFDQECADAIIELANWDTSRAKYKLCHDVAAHVASIRGTKLSELAATYEVKLKEALSGPVGALLDEANDWTWPIIRNFLKREMESAVSEFSSQLACYDIDEQSKNKMLSGLAKFGREIVEAKAREKAESVLIFMKDRFLTLISRDSDFMPRIWTGEEDIRKITKNARSDSLKLLSAMAAIRLDDTNDDNIQRTLFNALMSAPSTTTREISDTLASSTWEQVPTSKTLITPVECKSLWKQFNREIQYIEDIVYRGSKRNSKWWWSVPLAVVVLAFLHKGGITQPRASTE